MCQILIGWIDLDTQKPRIVGATTRNKDCRHHNKQILRDKFTRLPVANGAGSLQLNVTVTVRSLFRVTLQAGPDVESHPTHLPKVEPLFGVAFKVRGVPVGKVPVHVAAQPRPTGVLFMVPEPTPVKSTVKGGRTAFSTASAS